MQIEYNSRDKTITIDDAIPQNFQLIYILLGLNLGNSILHIVSDILADQVSNWTLIWIALGLISILLLWFFITKRTIKNRYYTDSILHIECKITGDRYRYRMVLHDRRIRELVTILGDEEKIEDFEKIWDDIGIPIVKLE